MTAYRLPPTPESGVVWQRRVGEWIEWHVDDTTGRWYATSQPGWLGLRWSELLEQGEVTTEEPITESMEELADEIVNAAIVWCITDASAPALRRAVGRYNRKRHQLNDERTTG